MADGDPTPASPSPALSDPVRAKRDVKDGGRGRSSVQPTLKIPSPNALGEGQGRGPVRPPGDSTVELIISWLLRIGVWTSVAIIAFGFALLIAQDHDALLHSHKGGLEGLLKDGFPGEPAPASTYGGVIASIRHGQA